MGWMNTLDGLLGGGQQPSPEHAENNFEQIASMPPAGNLSGGLAAAFNSSQTPSFGQQAGQL